MRSLKFALLFAAVSVILAAAVSYWTFRVTAHNSWSQFDIGLFYLAFWPQLLAGLWGFSIHTSMQSFAVNCFGWGLIGFLLGAISRKRGATVQPSI